MKELSEIFNTPEALAFGQSVLHSLWQGMLIVGAYLLIQKFVPKAENKVWLGLSSFGLQFIASLVTFKALLPEKSTLSSFTMESNLHTAQSLSTSAKALTNPETIQAWLTGHANWVFAGWLLGFIFLALKQIGGLAFISYLRKNGLQTLSPKAENAFNAVLGRTTDRLPNLQVFESAKVSTAMVLGHFKPIILVPVSFASGLSQAQLELIFEHEIAHIRRNDFLINIMQNIFENVYFYHPAYWVVGNQIRENREHACDDKAAETDGERVLLAKTLAQLQLRNYTPQLAMTFGKPKMTMFNRIQRLLGVNPKPQSFRLLALLLMVGTLGTFGFVSQNTPEVKEKVENEEIQSIESNVGFDQGIEFEQVEVEHPKAAMAAVDTQIVEHRSKHINHNVNGDHIQMKSDKYDVDINPERIIINGEEQKLSAAQKADLKKHLKEMNDSNIEVQAISKKIQAEVSKIQDIQTDVMAKVDFNPQNDPEFKKAIKEIQEEGKKISEHAAEFQKKIEKLDPKDPEYETKMNKLEAEFQRKVADNEKRMEALEIDMSGFEAKMKDFEVKMEQEIEVPISKIEVVIEDMEDEIEAAASGLELHHDAIMKMLPKEVREEFENIPRPPKPPKPPKLKAPKVKAPKPPKPPKAATPPPPAPAPID
ncbi:M48 family metalloprotease [Marinilongibacter aquaticus]|uniref:M56 family metallopeptidase n=1 Tax=Marinilongibacter aquaticus TaxID=2975157 RepID=UPI0021BD5AD8|nr:M56 family metallopeptidase [Marinilongibacter aquaticus]UBM60369.1 M48 family metalloprotease [Marinilongibacter aquaticus]